MKTFLQVKRFFTRLAQITRLIFHLSFRSRDPRPVRLRLFFEQTGGAFLKLGQILSLRYDLLPEAYTDQLLHLLSRVKTLPIEKMKPVFRAETGHEPEELFAEFEETPIASASISQVYRARLKSGEVVAVKIQRPGIEEVFETDIVLASFLARVMSVFSFFRAWQLRELIQDFAEWTRRELDFRFETKNGAALREYSTASVRTVIPRVYEEWTTKRLMVSEFLEDIFSVDTVMRAVQENPAYRDKLLAEHQIDLKEMSYYFIADMMRQYLVDGFFHADPHPANIFFLPNNKLGYFDFGIMGEAGEERVYLLRIVYGILKRDLTYASQNFLGFSKSLFRREAELFKDRDKEAYEKYQKVIEKVEEIMVDNLRLDLEELLAPWYDAANKGNENRTNEETMAYVFTRMMMRTRKYGISLPNAAAIFFRTLVITGMVALRLEPSFDILQGLQRFFDDYPLYEAEEKIKERVAAPVPKEEIDPLSHLSFEQFLELKEEEEDRLLMAKERLGDLIMSYAEKYEEIRKLLH